MHEIRWSNEVGAEWARVPTALAASLLAPELVSAQPGQGLLPFEHQKAPHSSPRVILDYFHFIL